MGTRERLASLYASDASAATRFAYLLTGDRNDAEEIVQEAFMRVMARLRRPPDVNDLSPYLRQVIVNLTRDRHRRARLERTHRPDLVSHETKAERARPVATDDVTTYSARGITLRYPSAWHRASSSLTPYMGDPQEIVSVASYRLDPVDSTVLECAHLPTAAWELGPTDVLLSLQESSIDRKLPPRPSTFAGLPMTDDESPACARGQSFSHWFVGFSDAGRSLYAFVAMGPEVSEEQKNLVWAALDSLVVEPGPFPFVTPSAPSHPSVEPQPAIVTTPTDPPQAVAMRPTAVPSGFTLGPESVREIVASCVRDRPGDLASEFQQTLTRGTWPSFDGAVVHVSVTAGPAAACRAEDFGRGSGEPQARTVRGGKVARYFPDSEAEVSS